MRIADDQQIELLDALGGFRHARDGVAAVAEHDHRLEIVLLDHLVLRQQRRVEPAGRRDAGRFHHLDRLAVGAGLHVEARRHPVVFDLPDAAPVLPGALGEAVVERQRRDIEAEVGGALHVAVAAEDVGAVAEAADIAGGEQQDAAGANVGGADRELGLAHRPDQRRWPLLGENLGDALDLRFRQAADALDLGRIPLLDFLADVVHAVDALLDELLVLPAVLEDVPEHAVDGRDVRAGPHADKFGRVRGRAREPRVDHDVVAAVELVAFDQMLQRHRMRLGRIAAHDDHGLGVADVVVAVGHRAVAPGIGHAGDGGRVADARLVVDVVGAPERGELAVQIGAFVGELGGAEPVDRVRARLLADLEHLVADLVDRGLPGDSASTGRLRASSAISSGGRRGPARAPRRPWRSASRG